MEKAEVAAAAAAMAEFGGKRLARQLDFTPILRSPVGSRAGYTVPALSLSMGTVPEPTGPPSQAAIPEVKEGTPKKQKHCNCKNSKCLKLYCECFANGIYCDGCNCLNCHNNVEHETARQEAIGATLERNPNAFRPKIANSPHGSRVGKQEVGPTQVVVKHNKGCNCKKSGCLKKYCECFQANVLCSDNCKCMDCKNFEGSEERRALLRGNNYDNTMYQAANAAINGAIGSSGYGNFPVSRKRRNQEPHFGMYSNQPFQHNVHYTQGGHLKFATSSFPSQPVSRGTNSQAASKVTYRSPLAGVIQPQEVNGLCSVLVIVSEEAAKAIAEKNRTIANQEAKGNVKTPSDLTSEDSNDHKESETVKGANSSNEQVVRMCAEGSGLYENDMQHSRPASPGTMALMCYEKDTLLEVDSPRRPTIGSQNVPPEISSEQNFTESYEEQERMVLTKFRDYLNRLITRGSIKEETMCSSVARSETETNGQTVWSHSLKDGHLVNGIVKPLVPVVNHMSARVGGAALGSNNAFNPNIGLPIENAMWKPKMENTL